MRSNANLNIINLCMNITHFTIIFGFVDIKCVTLHPPTYEEATRIDPPDYDKAIESNISMREIYRETSQSQSVIEIPDSLILTTKEKITIFTVIMFFSFFLICLLLTVVSDIVFFILGVISLAMGIIVGMRLK